MVPGRVLAPPCWLGGGGGLLAGSAYQCPGLVIRTTATTFRGCWCSRGGGSARFRMAGRLPACVIDVGTGWVKWQERMSNRNGDMRRKA